MRAWAPIPVALLLAVACHSYRSDPRGLPKLPPGLGQTSPPRAPVPEWIPAARPSTHLKGTPDDPDGGVLLSGQRVSDGAIAAKQVTMPPLTGGARIPRRLGGGFVFWNAKALYHARSFLADLEPVTAVEVAIDGISFGAGFALVHQADGARFALEWPAKKRIALPVAGLIDEVASADGRAVMLVEPDLVLTLGAGQKTWRDMSSTARAVVSLHESGAELWLKLANSAALRVEADGALSAHRALPDALTASPDKVQDPRWPNSVRELPLERAIRRGVPVDEHSAVVEVAGAFARIDLVGGAILGVTPAALATNRDCDLLPVEEDVLALCRTNQGAAVVIAGVKSPTPKVERTFGTRGSFFAGSLGTLAFGGPCTERPVVGPVVCVRQRDKSWRELGEAPPLAGAAPDAGVAPSPTVVSRWIPIRDGGAVGVVAGAKAGLYDAASRTFVPFALDQASRQSALFSTRGEFLSDDFAVGEDGRIVGYSTNSSLVVHADGRVDESPHAFTTKASSGALALGQDTVGRLWQSNDFGQHWVEVSRPPGSQLQSARPTRCSRVGCELPGWYRLGYRSSSPAPTALDIAPNPPLVAHAKTPRLSCQRSSPPRTRWVTRALNADGVSTEELDFGARKVSAREDTLIAAPLELEAAEGGLLLGATLLERDLESREPAQLAALLQKGRVLRFVDLLNDPKIAETRFKWQDIVTRSALTAEGPPEVNAEIRASVPVLMEKALTGAGLLVPQPNGVILWARAGQPARVLSLGRENASFAPQSALLRAKDELVVLAEDDGCAARVVSITAAGARTLFDLPARATRRSCPANRDALAVAEDGSLAVLRMPSAEPPSADDPALLLSPGKHPAALGAWSTLTPCAPDAKGARALVVVARSWVKLDAPGFEPAENELTLGVLRFDSARICAETLAVAAPSINIADRDFATVVVARFGATPRADRRGYALGAEHAEDLSCQLSAP